MKNSGATLALIILLNTFVSDVVASCRKIANKDMLEYFCEGGQPSDLITIPETIEKLRITRMPLGRITADTFSRFGGNLWVLSCLYCEITDIDPNAFRQLVNLQQLSLNNNYLTTVKASWFEGLDYLTYLDLNYNNIRDIEDDVYRNLPNLIDLRVSGNQLRCLNLNEMSHLRELKRIFLSENSNFACPHAVSEFLEKQNVVFKPDPEWRKLASDTIDVPPSYTEEDHGALHSDERLEQPEMPYIPPTRDRMFHQDYAEHRYRQRRPTTTVRPTTSRQNEIPRVEPRFPPTRTSSPDSSSHQVMMPYPLSTPETLPAPPMIWEPSEDIKMIGTTDQGSQTERISMYPQHVLTYKTTPYPRDSILERLRAPAAESYAGSSVRDNHETTVESDRLSQTGTTLTYPLYVATSNNWERMTPGSIEVSHHSDSDITINSWSTDHSNRYPYWSHNRQSSPSSSDDRRFANTPDYPHKMIDESLIPDDVPVDPFVPVDKDRSETTTTMANVHYIRPSIASSSELMYSSSSPGESGDFYSVPYYEGTVTMHPSLQDYPEASTVDDDVTTTDKPLPECPTRNSANFSRIRSYIIVLTMSLIITIFGHVIAEGF